MASNSIKYGGTTLSLFFAPFVTGYTITATATNITQGGANINTLYAGYDNRAGNLQTASGAVTTAGTDIATLFNKYSPAIGVTGNYGLPKIKPPSTNAYYSGRVLQFSIAGTGPVKIDYSDSTAFSITINNPFTATSFNNYGYLGGVTYNYTITAGGGTGGYVTVTGSFSVPVL